MQQDGADISLRHISSQPGVTSPPLTSAIPNMDSSILNLVQEHLLSFIALTVATVIFGGLFIGDGTPISKQYPYVGQGLLKPWLNWTTADRWRLEELERVGYEKVCIFTPSCNNRGSRCSLLPLVAS
jgi:hypothetical protein